MYGGYEVWPSGNLQVIVLISTFVQNSENFKMKIGTCTGTLVAPSWILTAAHCFPKGTRKILLQFGEKFARGRWKCVGEGRQVVFYNGKLFGKVTNGVLFGKVVFGWADLAMVEVGGSCEGGPQPMEMHGRDRIEMEIKNNCTITGFGYTKSTPHQPPSWRPDSLNQLIVGSTDISFVIPGRILIRVGPRGYGPCKGDSGGPLICNGVLYGVLSRIVHGTKTENYFCGLPNGKAVYESVSDYLEWIDYVVSTRTSGSSGSGCVIVSWYVVIMCFVIIIVFGFR